MSRLKKLIKNPAILFHYANRLKLFNWMTDKLFLKFAYRILIGKKLNLKNPESFNEKLQWLKLYDRRQIYTTMVDKHEVKKYVADIIGEEYIIPTLGVWDKFEDIDIESLPKRFVLKCTHDSGGLAICKEKSSFDIDIAGKKLKRSLNNNYYKTYREWPYKNVKPRIIAEEYLEDDEDKELRDYKFFVFSGEVKALYIASDRDNKNTETKFDFFDMNFKHLNFTNGHPWADVLPHPPKNFEKMKELARKISKAIPHVRVDFYEVNGKIYFGEITFYHMGGMTPFDPPVWDEKLGGWIKLPEKQENNNVKNH